jgi:repressor LexA
VGISSLIEPGASIGKDISRLTVKYGYIGGVLTEKQKRVFDYLSGYISEKARAPTQIEIQRHFGYRTLGTVQDHLKALEKKGVIQRHPGKWGGIEIVDLSVPLLGRVAAGKPLEYLKVGQKVEVPKSMLGKSGAHYALEIVGDSMIGAGILNGDIVIIKSQNTAENGQLVVAQIKSESTFKRFFRKKNGIELHSAHEKFLPICIGPGDDFQISGVFRGLLRFEK